MAQQMKFLMHNPVMQMQESKTPSGYLEKGDLLEQRFFVYSTIVFFLGVNKKIRRKQNIHVL